MSHNPRNDFRNSANPSEPMSPVPAIMPLGGNVNGFELLDHTADVGVLARGETMGEAFAQAALGMVSVMTDLEGIEAREEREVEVEATDREALLVAWLTEFIYLFGVEGFLPRRIDVLEISETRIRAQCSGEKLDPSRHTVQTEVKAATYHMLEVTEKDGLWQVRVILDI